MRAVALVALGSWLTSLLCFTLAWLKGVVGAERREDAP